MRISTIGVRGCTEERHRGNRRAVAGAGDRERAEPAHPGIPSCRACCGRGEAAIPAG
jgi:hypothetical protein